MSHSNMTALLRAFHVLPAISQHMAQCVAFKYQYQKITWPHALNTDLKFAQGKWTNKNTYSFFVGQQLFPDPEEVLAELSQPFNEAFL